MKKYKKNKGLTKICDCARKNWSQCEHAWHFAFQWKKTKHRFSLGSQIDSKSAAEDEAATIRKQIKKGTYGKPTPKAEMTVRQLADEYLERYVKVKRPARVVPFTNALAVICRTEVHHPTRGGLALGDWPLADVVRDSVDRFREVRRPGTGTNRYLGYLRALWGWGLGANHITTSPFKQNGQVVIKLDKEHARSRRLADGEEAKLLAASGPHLQAVIIAAVETGMRRGEILSLQWEQVQGIDVKGKWLPGASIFLPHAKTKTTEDRWVPISTRLKGILNMRRTDAAGNAQPPDAYVFGTEVGTRVLGFKRAWATAVLKAHGQVPTFAANANFSPASRAALTKINLHFHDLRREAGSRWLEGGVPCAHGSRLARAFEHRSDVHLPHRNDDDERRCDGAV